MRMCNHTYSTCVYATHTCIRTHTYIHTYIGGWGGESFVKPPTGKSFRFVRACERASERSAMIIL